MRRHPFFVVKHLRSDPQPEPPSSLLSDNKKQRQRRSFRTSSCAMCSRLRSRRQRERFVAGQGKFMAEWNQRVHVASHHVTLVRRSLFPATCLRTRAMFPRIILKERLCFALLPKETGYSYAGDVRGTNPSLRFPESRSK